MEEQLGSGVLLTLGIASLAIGGAIKLLQQKRKEVVIKDVPQYYDDYHDLKNGLVSSPELTNIVLKGTVKKKDSKEVAFSDDNFSSIGTTRLDKVMDANGAILKFNEAVSVPFYLADNNNNEVTIENFSYDA